MNKYYKNVFTVIVLSEEPLENVDLDAIDYEVTDGHSVLYGFSVAPKEVSPKEMAALLVAAGSDPSFFQLDEDGRQVEL